MPLLISSLIPELLGIILSYEKLQDSSIRLWITGDKLIQRQLALGVTSVHLENAHEFVLCCVPPILKEFRYLRELTIQRNGHRILFSSNATSTIRSLSSTLRSLQLQFCDAHRIIFPSYSEPIEDDGGSKQEEKPPTPPSRFEDSEGNSCNEKDGWSLKKAYPQLETLNLDRCFFWTAAMVQQLPTSLTSLDHLKQPNAAEFIELIQALPPHLQHLKFTAIPIEMPQFLALLSRFNLQTVSWESTRKLNDPHEISLLPRTLTEAGLYSRVFASALSQAAIDQLPPDLTALSHLDSTLTGADLLSLAHLPELRKLADREFTGLTLSPAAVRRLPPKLHSLNVATDMDFISKEDWPPHLTSLECTPLTSKVSLSSLPPLTRLAFNGSKFILPLASFGDLPRTLLHFDGVCGPLEPGVIDIDFPPNLSSLQLSNRDTQWVIIEQMIVSITYPSSEQEGLGDFLLDPREPRHLLAATQPPKVISCFPYHSLPRHLTHLNLSQCPIPASQLIHLPPRLQLLDVVDIFEDADFDPSEPRYAEAVVQLNKIAEQEGIVSSPSPDCSLPASMASLLPRTLQIILGGACLWRNCDWRRLPPRLRSLFGPACTPPVPATIFSEAPFSRLMNIDVPLVGIDDELVKLLPSGLDIIQSGNHPDAAVAITKASLPYWPTMHYRFEDEELRNAFEELLEEREQALASSSISDLRRLFPKCYLNKLHQELD